MKFPKIPIPKQIKIDNGEIGGFWTIFNQSQSLIAPFSFIQLCMLTYVSIFKSYISIPAFVGVIVSFVIAAMLLYYIVLFPSIIIFGNRQSFNAERNPLNREVAALRVQLDNIEKLIKSKNP